MEVRTASCRCGALKARARGEPSVSWYFERQCPWVRIETEGPLREG